MMGNGNLRRTAFFNLLEQVSIQLREFVMSIPNYYLLA